MAILGADPAGAPACELCDQPAVVYVTELKDGRTTTRGLCASHATEAGHGQLLPDHPSNTERVARNLRRTVDFVRRHGRMPTSVVELAEGTRPGGSSPAVDVTDPTLREFLREADVALKFYDAHGRLPSGPQEMQPPPP